MTILTLLVKASNPRQVTLVDDLLKAEFENLDVEVKVSVNTSNKWLQVSLSGEDEVIAINYIKKEIGTCPVTIKDIKKFSNLKGYISKIDFDNQMLNVDVGVFEPKIVRAVIPLSYLQAQFADGQNVSLKKIAEICGFQVNLPLSTKIIALPNENDDKMPAELSTEQLEKILSWQHSLLDRLIVLNAPISQIEAVLERTRLSRDVIGIERLGLFEHALICKFGTDAAGLIPRIGGYLRHSAFVVFNPRESLGLIGQ